MTDGSMAVGVSKKRIIKKTQLCYCLLSTDVGFGSQKG